MLLGIAACLILTSQSTSAQNTDWSLDPELTLALAKVEAQQGYNKEVAGKFAEALKEYETVLGDITNSMQTAQRRGLTPTYDPYLVLGTAHLDIARMQYSLNMSQGFALHLIAAETSLQQSLSQAKVRPQLPGVTIPLWVIYMSLGDVYLYQGDADKARSAYSASVRYNPRAQRSQNALAYIDFLQKRKTVSQLQALNLKLTEWAKTIALSQVTQLIVKRAAQEFVSSRVGSIPGSLAGVAVDAVYYAVRPVKRTQ
jgi:tetratricopeptide (TPR) repeat protein